MFQKCAISFIINDYLISKMTLKINTEVLDDLCSRFLLNIPESEKTNMTRLCFHIEIAHWFYLDFFRPEDSNLPDCRMREFAKLIFEEYPFLLNPPNVNVEEVLDQWKEYKRTVPTYGAILLDSDLEYVLLVQGFWIKASWGFPKGKVNKSESPESCAAREVLEETGYDISGKIDKTQYAEHHLNEQLTRLYFVTNVPMNCAFKPKTRGEIKSVQWFNIDDLPAHKKDNACKRNLNMAANSFFMVIPFVKQIRRWIAAYKTKLDKSEIGSNVDKNTKGDDRGNSFVESTSAGKSLNNVLIAGKIKPESAKRQALLFGQKNNQELEIIRSLSKDNSPYVATRSVSPQQKRKVYGRGRGERLFKQHVIDYLTSDSSEPRRGRGILPVGYVPEAWKNFTFNSDELLQAMNARYK